MRITGGSFRSRRLVAPHGTTTRPTSDRVREALFSILCGVVAIDDARVLDLYAGTGALALEALSRGARHATVVERGRDALAALRANVDALGVRPRVRVVAAPVERALRAELAHESFDLVLVDPPYADVTSGAVARTLAPACARGLVAEGGVLVLEHASSDAPPELAPLSRIDARVYGDTALALFARAHEEPRDP